MAKKKVLIFIFIYVLLIGILDLSNAFIKASNSEEVNLDEGNFKFITLDHRRTSDIYWSNIGFNICLKETNGNPLSDKNRITIYYTDEGATHKVEPVDSEWNMTTYTISAELLRKKFNEKFKKIDPFYYEHYIATGATLYFNNIFRIYWGEDNVWKDKIMTLDGIKDPGFPGFGWSSNAMNDFPKHFDKPYEYHADPILPAQVVYYLEGTTTPISKVTTLTPISKEKWGKFGQPTYHTLASYKVVNGVRCELVQSYYTSITDANKKKYKVKNLDPSGSNKSDVKDQTNATIKEGGTLFVGIVRPVQMPDTSTSLEGELLEPCPYGVIKADNRGNEKFNVEEGIPTSENLYVNAFTPGYLSGYKYTKKEGERIYPVTVSKEWTLTWTTKEADGEDEDGKIIYKEVKKSKKETVSRVVMVKRDFSYYIIDNFDVYGIQMASFDNYALPNEKVIVEASNYSAPTVSYTANSSEERHMKEPEIKEVKLEGETKDGGDSCPTPDVEDFTNQAEEAVDKILVRNDKLVFNDKILMSEEWKEEKTIKPVGIKQEQNDVGNNVLYKNSLHIDTTKSNGEFYSIGTVSYKRIKSYQSQFEETINYDMELNDVKIHTPTICDAQITDLKSYNQMLYPDTSRASLILDKGFTINVPTVGQHIDILGYGYRDYAKYIASRKVKFPFDVYRGATYYSAGTWITLNSDTESYYIPTWVSEGNYTIQFEAAAINSESNNGENNKEYLANYDCSNYVAIDSIDVQVTGRLYNLQIYDITDYPLWESVFRKENSLKLTGTNYTVGINNQDGKLTGRLAKYTFPLVYGSHPENVKEGAMKLGYSTRFKLTTIGNMYEKEDYIKINPRFYYVDYHGNNRKEVDLYYTETFNQKRNYLVKVGGDKDQTNKKSFVLGNTYWQVPEKEITATSYIDGVTADSIRSRKNEMFSFGEIQLKNTFRTYIGDSSYIPSGVIPNSVGRKKVLQSVQSWYGEYYLPSDVHVVAKDFNLKKYAGERGYIDFTEDIWLNKGYIIVNFDIVTYQTGKNQGNLSYVNKENALKGYCNMWKLEGSQLTKTDTYGNTFEFKYGDYVMYDKEKSAAIDYKSGGTH